MPSVTYITHDGESHSVDVPEGVSAMAGAVDNAIPGILGDCGGSCSCATCHVMVAPEWQAAVGPASHEESELLAGRDDATGASRLACQIRITPALHGLVLRMPAEQY